MSKIIKKILPAINLFIIILSISICVLYTNIYYDKKDYVMTVLSVISIFLPIFIYLINSLFKYKIPSTVKFIYLFFIFISAVLGGIVNLYKTISFYDKLIHFTSGILVVWLAIKLLAKYFKPEKQKKIFHIIALTCINISIAALWEVGEFFFGLVTGKYVQKGLDDTMLDMIVAIIGGLIVTLIYVIKKKRK